jgi:hypothetical protein
VTWWCRKRKAPDEEPSVSPETKAVASRTEALASRVDALGIETRAVAREALLVRESNHFGPALIAAFSTPRRTHT